MVVREDFIVVPLTQLADEENIGDRRHRRICYVHSLWKGLQTGSILGNAVCLPYMYFKRGYSGLFLFSRLTTATGLASLGCAALSLTACAIRLRGQSKEAIFDRAFRINFNMLQSLIDRSALGTAVVSGAVTFLVGYPLGLRPHYGFNIPMQPLRKRLVLTVLCASWAMSLGVVSPFLMRNVYPKRIKEAFNRPSLTAAVNPSEMMKLIEKFK